ncbi:MAG: VOC family protein [Acidobacteriota bacterium]
MENTFRLFRVFVPVSDLAVGIKFYGELFDDPGREIRGGRHYIDCGEVILAIVENSGPPIADHLYFSVDDLDQVFDRAGKLGCLETGEVHGEPSGAIVIRPWRERSFYVRDPFGNGLCFVDSKTLFTGLA